MKIQTSISDYNSKKLILPFIGEIQFDEKGVIDVADDIAEKLKEIEGYCFSDFNEEKQKEKVKKEKEVEKEKTGDGPKKDVDGEKEKTGDNPMSAEEKESLKQTISSLDKMSELIELAKSYPEDEWRGFSKKNDIKAYLISKI